MGEQFGRYELVHRIGVGGMAEVYRARTFGPEGFVKDVVIKRILPAFSEDADFVTMFVNEARLAARLRHANVVQTFDFNQIDGVYYIAMEWVDGTDLRQILGRARRRCMPLPVASVAHVGVEALKGLHYASTLTEDGRPLNLVHRDISPHNLLLSFAGEVKVADFGIAKVAALASATHSGMLKGKLAYMSPEQTAGETLDARSDLFSLGIVLWEMLAGERLYKGGSDAEVFARARRAEIPPLEPRRPDMPSGFAAAVEKMLRPGRDERYPSAAAALEALSTFAGASDGLATSDYLRRLLPDRVASVDRERTTVAPSTAADAATGSAESVQLAPPDAPTRTRLAAGDARRPAGHQASQGDPSPLAAAAGQGVVAADEARVPPPGETARARRSRSVKLVSLALCLCLCGAAGWWATPLLLAPPPSASAKQASVALRVRSAPEGARLWADDVPVGVTPTTLWVAAGASVQLRARLGQRVARQLVQAEHATTVTLRPTAVGVAATASLPTASVAPDTGLAASDAAVVATAATPRSDAPGKAPPREVVRQRRRGRPEGWGQIDVVVSPWARVSIDGRRVGVTPLKHHRVRAGRHRVLLHNSELGKREVVRVRVRRGRAVMVRRGWD